MQVLARFFLSKSQARITANCEILSCLNVEVFMSLCKNDDDTRQNKNRPPKFFFNRHSRNTFKHIFEFEEKFKFQSRPDLNWSGKKFSFPVHFRKCWSRFCTDRKYRCRCRLRSIETPYLSKNTIFTQTLRHKFGSSLAQVMRAHFSLFSRWKLLQLGLDEHYKKLNEFRNREVPTTQDFLSVAVHYPWARAISQNKVPYYIKWEKMTQFFLMSESPSVQNKTTRLLSPGWAAAVARGFKTLSRCSKRITLVVSTEHISLIWVKVGSAGKKWATAEKSKLNSSISCAL